MNYTTKALRLGKIEYTFILLSILYFLFPPVRDYITFETMLMFMAVYLIILVSHKDALINSYIITFGATVLLLSVLHTLLNETGAIGNVSNRELKHFVAKLYQYVCMFFPIIIAYRTKYFADEKQKKIILWLCSLILIYVSISTLIELAINPLITRRSDFATNNEDYQSDNVVGGYYFVYGVTFICLLCAHLTIIARNRKERLIFFILSLFFGYFLIKAQFSIAMITTLIAVEYLLIKYTRPWISIAVFFASIIAIFILPSILSSLISVSSTDLLVERLSEIQTTVTTKSLSEGGDMAGRFGLYGNLIKAFFESPIWGHRTLGFDGHSTYLSIWADLGIIGGIPLFNLLFKTRNVVMGYFCDGTIEFKPYFLLLLLIGFLNPIHASLPVPFVIWFFVPLVLDEVYNSKTMTHPHE